LADQRPADSRPDLRSESGRLLRQLPQRTKAGIRVVLDIELPGEGRSKLTGETLYGKPDFGYAVRFVDVPTELADRIDAALRRLSEE